MKGSSDASTVVLDHVGFIVRDLEATSALLAQLGFTQTQRADHTRTDEHGAAVSAGSSQRSIMLGGGYIELMQITDPAKGHQLASATSVRHGLHIVAFGTGDAQLCHAQCLRNGVAAGPVLYWSRAVNEVGATGVAQFAYFGTAWEPHDPSYLCWVEHRTPELLRPPQLLQHANGALALVGMHYRGPRRDALAWAERLQTAGGRRVGVDAQGVEMALPNAFIRLDFDAAARSLEPSVLVMEFSDSQGLRQRCTGMGIVHQRLDHGALELDLRAQLGMVWVCRIAAPASKGEADGAA